MRQFWQLVGAEVHTLVGLLDDVGDISSALVITLATLRVAVAFVKQRTRRSTATCTQRHPRRHRRRQQRHRQLCGHPHAALLSAQQRRPDQTATSDRKSPDMCYDPQGQHHAP